MIQDIYKLHWNKILISLLVGCWSFMVNTLFSCNFLFIFNTAEKNSESGWFIMYLFISDYGDIYYLLSFLTMAIKKILILQTSLLHLQKCNLIFTKLNDNSYILRSFSKSSFKSNNNPFIKPTSQMTRGAGGHLRSPLFQMTLLWFWVHFQNSHSELDKDHVSYTPSQITWGITYSHHPWPPFQLTILIF